MAGHILSCGTLIVSLKAVVSRLFYTPRIRLPYTFDMVLYYIYINMNDINDRVVSLREELLVRIDTKSRLSSRVSSRATSPKQLMPQLHEKLPEFKMTLETPHMCAVDHWSALIAKSVHFLEIASCLFVGKDLSLSHW